MAVFSQPSVELFEEVFGAFLRPVAAKYTRRPGGSLLRRFVAAFAGDEAVGIGRHESKVKVDDGRFEVEL